MVTKLKASNGTLSFSSDGWCTVSLELQSGSLDLGADERRVVSEGLLRVMREAPIQIIGEIDGTPVGWVASLSEKHGTLYWGRYLDGYRLYAQAEDGGTIGFLTLTEAQRADWISELSSWKT